jgi:hypothetical protein
MEDGVPAGNDLVGHHAVARWRRAVAALYTLQVAKPVPSARTVASKPWKNHVPWKVEKSSGPVDVVGTTTEVVVPLIGIVVAVVGGVVVVC